MENTMCTSDTSLYLIQTGALCNANGEVKPDRGMDFQGEKDMEVNKTPIMK